MNASDIKPNFLNKSQIIRDVCSVDPSRTNKEIRDEVYRRFKIRVNANLVVSAVGTWASRSRDSKNYDLILAAFRRAFEAVDCNIERGRRFLSQAAQA